MTLYHKLVVKNGFIFTLHFVCLFLTVYLGGVQKPYTGEPFEQILAMSSREKNTYQIHPYTFQQTN